LYPDALVAQILAAATYPDQIVEADRWLQQHPDLKGETLGKEADKQPWDPSVKALVEFPSVLANMDKNLSWTSSLGDAYVNQQQQIMDAVQVMRDRAEKAGNLKSTPQEKVSHQGQTVVIEPADPQVVYVPEYDPWLVYGEPIGIWPGWYAYPGLYLAGPGMAFGFGFGIGFFGGFGWGWGHWDTIGITTGSCLTTTATYPTAEFSSIATISITPVDFTAERDSTAAAQVSTALDRSMDSRVRMPRRALIPALSVVLITEVLPEVSLPAGSPASVAVFTGAEVSTAAEEGTGNAVQRPQT
jgi:hypothetical protein